MLHVLNRIFMIIRNCVGWLVNRDFEQMDNFQISEKKKKDKTLSRRTMDWLIDFMID